MRNDRPPVLRLATVEGHPVTATGKKRVSKGPSLYEKRQCVIFQAERLIGQGDRIAKMLDALEDVSRRENLVVVHALWRDLACEASGLSQIGRNILARLD